MPHQWLSALVGPLRPAADSRADGQLHDQQATSKGSVSSADSKNGSLAGTKNGSQAGRNGSADSTPICAGEQQLQCPEESAEVKAQALEALDSAFCMHIYSTALKHLRNMFSYEVVIKEFSAILDRDDLDDVTNSSIANCLTNVEKNRYRDIVPYDSNRVELPPLAGAASKGSSNGTAGQPGSLIRTSSAPATRGHTYDDTYINASFISDPATISDSTNSGSCCCYSRHAVGYIATQGPLPNTVADFWRMVAAVDISAIVMLTELTMTTIGHGSSRAQCAAYFPDQLEACLRLPGGISVTCVHKARLSESLLFRQLEVVCPQQSQQKRLWVNHYKIADWPDFGVPGDSVAVRALSHALDGCRRAGCKIVVHCSAGVGRTGTFIAVDVILQRLHSLTLQAHGSVTDDDIRAAIDIQALVAGLRKQRRGTVQTSEQYAFIWQAVIDEIEVLLQQEWQQQQELQQLAATLRQDLQVQ